MELIKQLNGWKLYKGSNLQDYTIVTPEGFEDYRPKSSVEEFDKAVDRGWIWQNVVYFEGHIKDGRVVVSKHDKSIRSNFVVEFYKDNVKEKEEVLNKIAPLLKKADKKFLEFSKALEKLQKDKRFNIDYMVEGDTHGVRDYMYIDFEIDWVSCRYTIDN